jgi:flagellar protein FlaG
MSFEIGRVTPAGTPPAAPAQRPAAAGGADFAAHLAGAAAKRDVATVGVPATPPPDVMKEVEAAGRRAAELAAQHRELHFEKDATSGRVIVQVRDLDGNVLRTIPPSRALEVMSGAAL